MFEKYTEKARRAVFFGRYEASTFGSRQIEIEHLLLGILREDHELASRILQTRQQVDSIREQIEKHYPKGESISTSVDLPVSYECKRALVKAQKESKRRKQKHIGPEHLLLGIYLEEASFAAKILRESGVTSEGLSAEADRSTPGGAQSATVSDEAAEATTAEPLRELAERAAKAMNEATARLKESRTASERSPEVVRNLSEAARNGKLNPLIGREREVERIFEILSRRTRNNPVLVGESGVGKTAILEGLAQRISDGNVPAVLADRAVFAIDASSLVAPSRRSKSTDSPDRLITHLTAHPIGILCVDGLLDFAASPGWGAIEATHVLDVLSRSGVQCIATGTPAGLRRAFENAGVLVRHFEVVEVAPPTEEEAVRILAGLKPRYELFHGVVFGDGVIEAAVFASGRFLPHRQLPDRALDLLDDAGARAKVRRELEPRGSAEIRQRIRVILQKMENAIGSHEFDKAKEYAEQEKLERDKLRLLQAERKPEARPANTVSVSDLEQAIAERAGVPVSAVQEILRQKKGKEVQAVAQRLAAAVPGDQLGWLPFLAAYLAGCSAEDAESLTQAIREAKKA